MKIPIIQPPIPKLGPILLPGECCDTVDAVAVVVTSEDWLVEVPIEEVASRKINVSFLSRTLTCGADGWTCSSRENRRRRSA